MININIIIYLGIKNLNFPTVQKIFPRFKEFSIVVEIATATWLIKFTLVHKIFPRFIEFSLGLQIFPRFIDFSHGLQNFPTVHKIFQRIEKFSHASSNFHSPLVHKICQCYLKIFPQFQEFCSVVQCPRKMGYISRLLAYLF